MAKDSWAKEYDSGLSIIDDDLSSALKHFINSSDRSGKKCSMLSDVLTEPLMERLCRGLIDDECLGLCSELVNVIYCGSEGETFLLGDMLQRAPAFIDGPDCRYLFLNLLHISPGSLLGIADPEVYGNVFDGLCALSDDCANAGGFFEEEHSIILRLKLIRDCFTGCWMDLDEDDFFEVVGNLEDSDPLTANRMLADAMVCAEKGSEDSFRRNLERFLSFFFLL